jgi:methionine-rich copper-binding protein CopC
VTKRTLPLLSLLLALMLAAPLAWGHAFPKTSSPAPDATLEHVPNRVQIRFTGDIEPHFSTLVVKNAQGKQVSIGRGEVSSSDSAVLQTRLPADSLGPGTYSEYWSVVARDGHHTQGHFSFTVK